MEYFKSHKLVFSTVIVQVLLLPAILFVVKHQQETGIHAQKSNTNNYIYTPTPIPTETQTPTQELTPTPSQSDTAGY